MECSFYMKPQKFVEYRIDKTGQLTAYTWNPMHGARLIRISLDKAKLLIATGQAIEKKRFGVCKCRSLR